MSWFVSSIESCGFFLAGTKVKRKMADKNEVFSILLKWLMNAFL